MIDLHDYLNIGQNSIASKVVQHSDTSDAYANELKDLLATPKLIHMALDAAIESIDPYLPDEYVSVGVSINFVHTAPTALGMTVTVRTSIVAIEAHDVIIEIKAWDEQGDIGYGTHKRAIVTKDAVRAKAEERTRLLMNRQSIQAMRGQGR